MESMSSFGPRAPRTPESLEVLRRRSERLRRCRALPPLQPGEAERLVAAFLAHGGSLTRCPPVYLIPTQQ